MRNVVYVRCLCIYRIMASDVTTMEEAKYVQSEVVAPEQEGDGGEVVQQEGDGGEVVQQEENGEQPVQREGVGEGTSGGGEDGATVDLQEAQGILRSTKRNSFGI